ncbi:hypothetical protein [Embleya sp. NPDC059259]|uniref:hypothetical protein n=1 Tax=unclassified Embleya TaxID=2699296 RepID=UPI0036BCC24C
MKKDPLKNRRTLCGCPPIPTTGPALPGSAVIVVVVILVIAAGLTVRGYTMESVTTILTVGGVIGAEIIRRLVAVFVPRRTV